jgi:transposase-like protein
MTFIAVCCPHCQSEQIVKRGKTRRGTQRSLCQNTACTTGSFLLDYRNRGCLPEVKHTIIDMRLNASGIRDPARVLRISTDTVLSERKKKEALLVSVHTALLRTLNPEQSVVDIAQAGEAEIDAMWSFVGNKGHPRWLWHAIEHHTGAVVGLCVWASSGRGVSAAQSVAGTLWSHPLFYGSLGCLHAASGP